MFIVNNKDTRATLCWLWTAVCLFEPCLLCSARSCFFGLWMKRNNFTCTKILLWKNQKLLREDELKLTDINLKLILIFIVKMQNICNLIGWNSVHICDIINIRKQIHCKPSNTKQMNRLQNIQIEIRKYKAVRKYKT